MRFESEHSAKQLAERWDERTGEARFAGNDEVLDAIFVAKRRGNSLRLVYKAKSLRDPFASIFHGKIREDENGRGYITGFFAKSILDYTILLLFFGFLLIIRNELIVRGEGLTAINAIMLMFVILSIFLLLTLPSTKRRYIELINEVTESEKRI